MHNGSFLKVLLWILSFLPVEKLPAYSWSPKHTSVEALLCAIFCGCLKSHFLPTFSELVKLKEALYMFFAIKNWPFFFSMLHNIILKKFQVKSLMPNQFLKNEFQKFILVINILEWVLNGKICWYFSCKKTIKICKFA